MTSMRSLADGRAERTRARSRRIFRSGSRMDVHATRTDRVWTAAMLRVKSILLYFLATLVFAALLTLHIPLLGTGQALATERLPLDLIKLPPGFDIALWARVDNAREMTLGKPGIIYVGSMSAGKVHAVRYDTDYRVTQVIQIDQGLQMPAGVAYRKGSLYVSAVSRILRYDDIDNHLDYPPRPTVVTDRLPKETHHGWKFIAFGPDDKLYVPIGAPCNICEPDPERYAQIVRMNPDGRDWQIVARGVRNSVGFDWQPGSASLWFTDNGRDLLGDDLPPDELNVLSKPGLNFGYPYCHAGTIADPEFGQKHSCAEFTPPAMALGPHVAALGMRFYRGKQFPEAYRKQIFIAEHGSWNRSKKIGYRISLVSVKDGRATAYQTFASGWLQGEQAWGRPVDVLELPDGSLLVSDDQAGAIYRITYGNSRGTSAQR
jgi:glucose/arabinose dehydrogenase